MIHHTPPTVSTTWEMMSGTHVNINCSRAVYVVFAVETMTHCTMRKMCLTYCQIFTLPSVLLGAVASTTQYSMLGTDGDESPHNINDTKKSKQEINMTVSMIMTGRKNQQERSQKIHTIMRWSYDDRRRRWSRDCTRPSNCPEHMVRQLIEILHDLDIKRNGVWSVLTTTSY